MRDHMDWLDEDLASETVADRLAMIRAHEGENYDPGYGTEHERVRLIRDTDGDGQADVAVVFADGFKDHAAGIGAGLLSYEGDVYYTCIPDLWLLRDRDGDGVADEREKLSSGYGVNIALLGHDLHGLRIGPDRRLYFSCGDRGFHVETESGVLAPSPDRRRAALQPGRDRPRGVAHGAAQSPGARLRRLRGTSSPATTTPTGVTRARWVHIVEGADSGWRYSYQWITEPVMRGPWNDEKLWHPPFDGQAAYIVPPIQNLADGPAGLAYYPGTGFTPEYAGRFFLCDFRGDARYSGIHSFTVRPKGAFWELGPVERFVWSTLVTDCDFGPDGSLYFTDWVPRLEQDRQGPGLPRLPSRGACVRARGGDPGVARHGHVGARGGLAARAPRPSGSARPTGSPLRARAARARGLQCARQRCAGIGSAPRAPPRHLGDSASRDAPSRVP